ncbi:MAG: 3-dehydroquinate synthase [Gammaproteobacteria bacterium]|nr:MAG: 3-dehydroquinate synthase [Gammaproteobacteria bacterium]
MTVSHTVSVDLGERSYPIYIGSGLLHEPEFLVNHIPGNSALIVTNTVVAPLYLEAVEQALRAHDIRHDSLILEDGEQYKTVATAEKIINCLLQNRHDRQTSLIALGGGVIGDITGFAAAIYQRGVHFIQIPTTLLSQVDSSVGGKTGVNHPLGKNMIGAFHQPQCVIADTDTLDTLPTRELSAGLAEVIKYGLIHDADFFDWLEQNIELLKNRDYAALCQAILVSCNIKAEVVSLDERESGIRAILNLGHTFGHAIEATMGYGNWLHGEAVATGMVMAADLSQRQQWIDRTVKLRTISLLEQANLPVRSPPEMSVDDYMQAMVIDKKTVNGTIKLVLLKKLGEAVISSDYDPALLEKTLLEA